VTGTGGKAAVVLGGTIGVEIKKESKRNRENACRRPQAADYNHKIGHKNTEEKKKNNTPREGGRPWQKQWSAKRGANSRTCIA